MNKLRQIKLWRIDKNDFVDASLIELTRNIAQTEIDAKWWQLPDVPTSKRKAENDNHWNWTRNVGSHRNQILWECVAVLSVEEKIEGAMIMRFDLKSRLEENQGCVYIDYLATAPRNRAWLVENPVYKGVGTELVYWAVRQSFAAGFNGRVSLDADPKPETLEFYQSRGFIAVEPFNEGLEGYELAADFAEEWAKQRNEDIFNA